MEIFWSRVIYYVMIGAAFLALVGNFLMFIVYSMGTYRRSLASMLYRILAVAQTFYVVMSDGLHTISLYIGHVSLFTYNIATCKAFLFMQIWLRAFIAWVLAIIALERVIVVVFPYRVQVLNTKGHYGWLLLGMSLFLFLIYAPLIFVVEHDNLIGLGATCIVGRKDGTLQWYWHGLYKWMNLVMNSLLPFAIIISFNIVIIIGLVKSQRSVASSANSSSSLVNFNSQIFILMSISFTFIIMSLPYPLYFIIATHYNGEGLAPNDTPYPLQILGNLGPVCDTVSNSVTIIFYCLFGKKFRQCLTRLFCCKWRSASQVTMGTSQWTDAVNRLW